MRLLSTAASIAIALIAPNTTVNTPAQEVKIDRIYGSRCINQIGDKRFDCHHLTTGRKDGRIFFFFQSASEDFGLVYAAEDRPIVTNARAYFKVYKIFVQENGRVVSAVREVPGYCTLDPEIIEAKAGCVASFGEYKSVSVVLN